MQSGICRKDTLNEEVGFRAAFVFDDPHELDTSDGMFHAYPDTGNFPVEFFFFLEKLLSLSFLNRLNDARPSGSISLMCWCPDTRCKGLFLYMQKLRSWLRSLLFISYSDK
nr:hypothetical protein [Bacteroides ihuae]